MEFNNRLYQLRKQSGMSQEELANRLNVSRQTISKWEIGDSTPEMEKLIAIHDLFHISLDELVLGKSPDSEKNSSTTSGIINVLEQKILTSENKRKLKSGLKVTAIVLGLIVAIDIISMLIYFIVFGVPH